MDIGENLHGSTHLRLLGGIFKFGQQPTVSKTEILELLCQSIEELVRRSNGVRVV